jgi:putative membrane protein insertion efficiency factor
MRRLRLRLVLLLAAALLVIHDTWVPVRRSYSTHALLFAIDGYQAHVSPHLKGLKICRFTPTCSVYGRESVRKYGAARGGLRAAWRVMRCGPWTKRGTVDRP